ncbi:glycosyltransferase [Dyella solisilvae]|uniref:glycosyltransferase n=1 Tax=Dyella solisilvae TaxID=1920168 RepID=UPI001313DCCE|nr:glycosyltransferase [Dyella solisilvae]
MAARADRIVLVLPSLERGGGERVLLQLAGLFLTAGREVHVVTLIGGGALRSLVPAGVTLHELIDGGDPPKGLALAWKAYPRLISLVRKTKPHAVLSTMTGTNLLAVLACKRARVRIRLVLREAASLVNAKGFLKRQAMRWLYGLADGIVAVSAGVAQDLRKLGLPHDRIHVIRNPVDVERLRYLAEVGPSLSRHVDESYVATLGRLAEQKDHATLLHAYAASALRASHRLVIVGEGEEHEKLLWLVKELGLTDRVEFTGAMDNPYHVLANAKLHVLSSRWEGYPNVLLEALALGVPVVSTDCPHGPREILDDGRYGRLVPVADCAILARAMDAELKQPASGVDAVLATHRPQVVASRYLALLDGGVGEEQS